MALAAISLESTRIIFGTFAANPDIIFTRSTASGWNTIIL